MHHEAGFKAADNSYSTEEFFKVCEDYPVPHDPMRYTDEKFYWTYQCGVGWQDDYIEPDSMTYQCGVGWQDDYIEPDSMTYQCGVGWQDDYIEPDSMTYQCGVGWQDDYIEPDSVTYQCGVGWQDDYIEPDSMTCCIIEKSQGCLEYQREH